MNYICTQDIIDEIIALLTFTPDNLYLKPQLIYHTTFEDFLNYIEEFEVNINGSVLNRVGSPPSCGHPLITRYSGGLEWGPG